MRTRDSWCEAKCKRRFVNICSRDLNAFEFKASVFYIEVTGIKRKPCMYVVWLYTSINSRDFSGFNWRAEGPREKKEEVLRRRCRYSRCRAVLVAISKIPWSGLICIQFALSVRFRSFAYQTYIILHFSVRENRTNFRSRSYEYYRYLR